MRPTQALCKRLKTRIRFTTKQVGKDFYRGSGTGSMGAHTQWGNYLIDWRKVRHYVVPDLRNTKLTPFVSGDKYIREELHTDPAGKPYDPKNIDGMQYLQWWKQENSTEYEYALRMENDQEEASRANADNNEAQEQEQEPSLEREAAPSRPVAA